LTKEGEVIAKVVDETEGVEIDYELVDTSGGKYGVSKYPDGSVKLVFNGPINPRLDEPEYLTIKVRLILKIFKYKIPFK
jgi:hypothetical protein